jgi:hypothetical protein
VGVLRATPQDVESFVESSPHDVVADSLCSARVDAALTMFA